MHACWDLLRRKYFALLVFLATQFLALERFRILRFECYQ
jgi:hypothetical protein